MKTDEATKTIETVREKKLHSSELKQRGITLIALVVTIVVLLILAGVTITLMFGDNNIFGLAKKAGDKTNVAIEDEKTAMEGLDKYIKDNAEGTENSGGESSTGGGSSEEWKKLTLSEKLSILREKKPILNLYGDVNSVCECGHASEIFKKANELGLISTYDNMRAETDEEGNACDFIEAPITEPSLVYYSFFCLNNEQGFGGIIPMPQSLNYEICIDGTNWEDSGKPTHDSKSGDFELNYTWLGPDYVNIGFTMLRVRAVMYPNIHLSETGQVYHMSINVLTKTNFNKAVNALGLDLSSYNCIHNK